MNRKNSKYVELILVVLVWVLLIAGPVFLRNDDFSDWKDLLIPGRTIIPLVIIFLLNRFLLVPKLLFQKRSLAYLFSVGGLIAILTLGSLLSQGNPDPRPPQPEINQQGRRPPHLRQDRAEIGLPPPREVRRNKPMPPYVNFLIFSVLLVGFDTGLRVSFRLADTERAKAKLEKEHVGTQLAFLRTQVSPHFFMNTLNNIHSLIDLNSEEAKESIIRLSKLMRHLLYESETEKIPIQKEIDFIKNYVDLMKLRYSDKVKINLKLPDQLPDRSIPPLLFTSYVENAFKHGISYQQSSFVDISFSSTEENLTFEIKNSNPQFGKEGSTQGIGTENARKRLDLIYGNNYTLKAEDTKDEYYVSLSIPL